MKKIFLFLLLALSLSANAQINKKKFFMLLQGGASSPSQLFQQRVEADGGSFESTGFENILTELGSNYTASSFVLTPNAYKASKLYAAKPTDGGGDFAFTRTTNGHRKGATYLEEMGFNFPRLDYLGLSSPTLLLEPARTNLIVRSQELFSTAWTQIAATKAGDNRAIATLSGADNIFISGNYAYITSNLGSALEIVDISNPLIPIHVGKISHGDGGALLSGAIGVYVSGNYAYVTAMVSNALEIVDISNPSAPTHVGSIVHGAGGAQLTSAWNIDVVGNYAYIVANNALEIIDISVPATPTHVGSIVHGAGGALLTVPLDVEVVGNYAYIAVFGSDALEIVNISNPASPTHAGSLVNGGGALLDGAHGISINGNYAYICSRNNDALEIIDITNPAAPVHYASLSDGVGGAALNGAVDIHIIGNYAYISSYEGSALEIVDISNPSTPTHVGKLQTNEGGASLVNADMVWVDGDYAYLTCYSGSNLEVVDISNPATPVHVSKIMDESSFRIMETTANNVHLTRNTLAKAASSLSYVFTIVLKGGLNRDWVCLQGDDGTNLAGKFFNLSNGTLGNDRTSGSGFAIQESRIINLGTAGYLCAIRITTSTSTTLNFTLLGSTDGSNVVYAGDVARGYFATKANIIQSTAPLTDSFIQGNISRTADVITPKTSASSLIGQTQGTVFFWVNNSWADAISKAVSISDGTANNRVTIDFTTGNLINALVVSGGVTQATISNGGFTSLTEYKVAITYQSGKAALFVNGTKVGEDLTVTVPACDRIGFDSGAGSNPFYGNIKALTLSPTALSDADAQALTTL